MLWRHLCLVRAWSAAGLLTSLLCASSARAETDAPPPPAAAVTETVSLLDARRAGDLEVEARGQGQSQVRLALRNTSAKRLNVVLPPGLVASSVVGQAGRGGFQSMGLGSVANRPGGFGEFRADDAASAGLRSVAPVEDRLPTSVAVPAGRSVELSLPAVCLNFGVATPTPKDRFDVVDVDDYTSDRRSRLALRTVATLGTSQGVAQAIMWNVFNDVPFAAMTAQHGKVMNEHEVGLAARFVATLEAAPDATALNPSYLQDARVFVQVEGAEGLDAEAHRLATALDGLRLLGLPARVVEGREPPEAGAPAIFVRVTLTATRPGETKGRVVVSHLTAEDGWAPLGKCYFVEGSTASVLDGRGLAVALDHSLASAFVSVKTIRKISGSTTLRVENRLPFTLSSVQIKANGSSGAPTVAFPGLGIGPVRSVQVSIQAPGGTIERVEANGL